MGSLIQQNYAYFGRVLNILHNISPVAAKKGYLLNLH
jgi:hypothetical protein